MKILFLFHISHKLYPYQMNLKHMVKKRFIVFLFLCAKICAYLWVVFSIIHIFLDYQLCLSLRGIERNVEIKVRINRFWENMLYVLVISFEKIPILHVHIDIWCQITDKFG